MEKFQLDMEDAQSLNSGNDNVVDLQNTEEMDIGIEIRKPLPPPAPGSEVEGLRIAYGERVSQGEDGKTGVAKNGTIWCVLTLWKYTVFALPAVQVVSALAFSQALGFVQLSAGDTPVAALFLGMALGVAVWGVLWALGYITKQCVLVQEPRGGSYYRDSSWCQFFYVLLNLVFLFIGLGIAIYLGVKCKDEPTAEGCEAGANFPVLGRGNSTRL